FPATARLYTGRFSREPRSIVALVLPVCSAQVSRYRVRGWHYCHRPPLRTVRATFTAHGSSISNALFGGRGTATEAFYDISLSVQLRVTNRMHHNQIGH